VEITLEKLEVSSRNFFGRNGSAIRVAIAGKAPELAKYKSSEPARKPE